MKRLLLGLLLACGLVLASPTLDASADSDGWSDADSSSSTGFRGVPELDTTVAGSAMVLLLGGVAYLASRRRDDS